MFLRAVLRLILLLVAAMAGQLGWAQDDFPYELRVFVQNEMHKPVSGANVNLYGPVGVGGIASLVPLTKVTRTSGSVAFTFPKPGKYLIKVTHPNFETAEQETTITEKGTVNTATVDLRSSSTKFRIKVTAVAADTQDPIEGATAWATVNRGISNERLTTDSMGIAYLMMNSLRYEEEVTVQITHPDYLPDTFKFKVERGANDQDYPVRFSLMRGKGKRQITVHVVESGSRHPILGAQVRIDGGLGGSQTQATDGDGRASFSVTQGTIYHVAITASQYDSVEDSIDMTRSTTESRGYEMDKKNGARDMRRVLIVTVKYRTKAGALRPVADATIDCPGIHDGVTDASGRATVLHRLPPGELLRVNVSKVSFESGSGEAIIRTNGAMANVDEVSKMTLDGKMSYLEAIQKLGVTAVDTLQIILKETNFDIAELSGDVVPAKGVVNVDEQTQVGVHVLYEGHEDQIEVRETVELIGPSGAVVQNNFGTRTLKDREYSRRVFNITCKEAGVYTLKSTVVGPDNLTWTDKASFTVKSVTTKPKTGSGYFKLVDKKVGIAPPPGVGRDGTTTVSLSESSLTMTFLPNSGYPYHGEVNLTWSMPPEFIKPGQEFDLTITGSASGNTLGDSGKWGAEGSVTYLEGTGCFVGLASNGKEYNSGTAKYRFRAGSGGKIVLYSFQDIGSWANTGTLDPCRYNYIWVENEAPPTGGSGDKTASINPGPTTNVPEMSGSYSGTVNMHTAGVNYNSRVTITVVDSGGQKKFTAVATPVGGKGYTLNLAGTIGADGKINGSSTKAPGPGLNARITGSFNKDRGGFDVFIMVRATDNSVKPSGSGFIGK